jgi:hypothetical protein
MGLAGGNGLGRQRTASRRPRELHIELGHSKASLPNEAVPEIKIGKGNVLLCH